MRFLNLFKLALLAVTLSGVCFHPSIIRAEDEEVIERPDTLPPAQSELRQSEASIFAQTEANQPNPPPAPVARPSQAEVENNTIDAEAENNDLGIGRFEPLPFHVTASVVLGYDDNVVTALGQGNASTYIHPNIDLNYAFMDPRTTAKLKAGVGFNYYFDQPSDQAYDVNVSVGLSLVHKASPRLTLSAETNLSYLTEPDFSVSVGNRRSGNYFYTVDEFKGTYQWQPRFATATSYSLFFVNYDDDVVGRFQDRAQHTFGNEFRFALQPSTILVGDVRFEIVDHTQTPTVSSPQDSTSEFLLAGFEHTFNPRLNVSLRGGAQLRSYDNDGGDTTEPYFESTLSYAAGKRSVLSWTNHYGLEEPDLGKNQSRTTFRTGLTGTYSFTSRISAGVGFYYIHDDYAQGPPFILFGFIFPGAPPFDENSVDVSLNVRYQINRDFSAFVGYEHTQIFSDISTREYSRNRGFGGLTFAF